MSDRTVYTIVATINFTPNAIGADPAPVLDAVDEALGALFEDGLADLDISAEANVVSYRRGLTDGDGR